MRDPRPLFCLCRYLTNTRIKLITVTDDESVKEEEVRLVSQAETNLSP